MGGRPCRTCSVVRRCAGSRSGLMRCTASCRRDSCLSGRSAAPSVGSTTSSMSGSSSSWGCVNTHAAAAASRQEVSAMPHGQARTGSTCSSRAGERMQRRGSAVGHAAAVQAQANAAQANAAAVQAQANAAQANAAQANAAVVQVQANPGAWYGVPALGSAVHACVRACTVERMLRYESLVRCAREGSQRHCCSGVCGGWPCGSCPTMKTTCGRGRRRTRADAPARVQVAGPIPPANPERGCGDPPCGLAPPKLPTVTRPQRPH